MSEITKTEAFVLSKIDYGDTSNIISIFTMDYGRISAIFKGVKKAKNGKGGIIDLPNHLRIVLYSKSTRDVQLISEAEIIDHYPKVKQDYEKLKYSYAVLEILKKLLPEHEPNLKIFKGTVRIMQLLEKGEEYPGITFGRFFMFLLAESGYEIQLNRCASCGKATGAENRLSYTMEIGILCADCKERYLNSFGINPELFNYLMCLKNNLVVNDAGTDIPEMAIIFMERYSRHHVPGFKGIQTFQILR